MSSIRIVGGKPLDGEVRVSGSKNATLPLLAAALLVDGESYIENVPRIDDIHVMIRMLDSLGADCEFIDSSTLRIDASNISSVRAPYDLVRKMRGSFYVAGALLARSGEAEVPLPGGCVIGSRPVDFHINGFKQLGAVVREEHGVMYARADQLTGAHIIMDSRYCSVGATVNIMLAATLAEGTTIIENASREPEVVCCEQFLCDAGARIEGVDTNVLTIHGVDSLHGCRFRSIPDRLEAGTFLMAGAVTGGDVITTSVQPRHMTTVLDVLWKAGLQVEIGPDWVRVVGDRRPMAFEINTAPYPGFPTDLQPNATVLAALAVGTSIIEETIFDARFTHVDELMRMGANIQVKDSVAIIRGVRKLSGAPVEATDIRAGSALVLAGLAAQGATEVSAAEFLDRGYEDVEAKFRNIGGDMTRIAMPEGGSAEYAETR
ncbi:MAG: UDP-N-acetylglucosamine 1-carboxyvinyltransferase [Armatimonadota bacterium]